MQFSLRRFCLAGNNGKKLEARTTLTLKELTSKTRANYHRFTDKTQAMSGFVPAQPADFLLLVPGKAILVECKSTTSGTSLIAMAHQEKTQIAEHKKWHRAEHPSIYVYLNLGTDRLEIHNGKNVVKKVNEPLFIGTSKQMMEGLKFILESLK